MRVSIDMPNLGYEMETGIVVGWLKSVGDTITRGEPIAEVEGDKATLQMPALAAGILVEIVHDVGAEVAVGDTIAFLETEN